MDESTTTSSSICRTIISPISDWLWIDYHDRINVLVEAPSIASNSSSSSSSSTNERQFYVFDQSKYALEGRTSMAIIGGIIEPGESPERAAMREVEEEMHVTCDQLHWLGRFRTDVESWYGMGKFIFGNSVSTHEYQAK
jgi:8-oxo-dGTP pyrophosphatase MutT (NUDIX family)